MEPRLSEPALQAKEAGLRYVSDEMPGIRRRTSGASFIYEDAEGHRVRDPATLDRIAKLALPPAYTDVWICPLANGHLQATGKDARGRKQYRYHEKWRRFRDQTKYDRMIAFGKALPSIRARVAEDLNKRGFPREKILATVVDLLDKTHIRIGNDEYAHSNRSYGLTTLRNKHVDVEGQTIHFEFKGKSGVMHRIALDDPKLARIIKKCQDLPGYEVFQYLDERGQRKRVDSADVNQYIKEIAGEDFTAKDFRTWHGTVLAVKALQNTAAFTSESEAKRFIVQAIDSVAEQLGNTRAVCRKCYVHPEVLDAYLQGQLAERLRRKSRLPKALSDLDTDEAAVILFLLGNEKRSTGKASARAKA